MIPRQQKRKSNTTTLPKKTKYSVARARARKAFQLFVRFRDTNEYGAGFCCTCAKLIYLGGAQGGAQGGHFISAQVNATLFDERNCHLQCKNCNGRRNVHHLYRNFLIKRYGEEAVKKLEQKALMKCSYSVEKLLTLELYYQLAMVSFI